MRLNIDGRDVDIEQSQTIRDAVLKLGLESEKLSERPLAARIGGDVYNLSYTPYKDAALRLIRYQEDYGRRVYECTAQFVLLLSCRKLFPGARVRVCYALDAGIYITIAKEPALSPQDVRALEKECRRLSAQDLPIRRRRMNIAEALAFFEADGQLDKARLLRWRRFSYFDVYALDGYMDYFYGEMAPSTGYVEAMRLKPLAGALVMLMPCAEAPDDPPTFQHQPKLAEMFRRSERWNKLMHCSSVNELNVMVQDGRVRELVRVNEALHEKTYAQLADQIVSRNARAVMVAGPSSSGKTTSANRLATQLRVLGHEPIMLSLDDYYIDRECVAVDDKGERDLEHINTLDISRFKRDLLALVNGDEVEVPLFDFCQGKRATAGRRVKLHADQQLIVEGLHALNDELISHMPCETIFRVYVSALGTLNLDDHNRIRTADVRLLRRLVRDHATRGASMEDTLRMWPSVRRGEKRWIFPWQEHADAIFNTTLVYEIAALKKYAYPLLRQVHKESPFYMQSQAIIKFLNYFVDADVEEEIPPTSILREFIGGNTFYRQERGQE